MIRKIIFLCSFSVFLVGCTENGFFFKSKGEDYNKESLGVYKIDELTRYNRGEGNKYMELDYDDPDYIKTKILKYI